MMNARIYVVGATGAVGRRMLYELERYGYGAKARVTMCASPRSAGVELAFAGSLHQVQAFSVDDIEPGSFVLLSAGGAFSRQHAMAMVERGATVIDNSSAWRMDPEVPLIVPEVNGVKLLEWSGPGIIANPNCSTIQLVVSLRPLVERFGIDAVNVVTFQSVSGAGQKGLDDLERGLSAGATPQHLPRPIAGNVIPAIDVLGKDGHCFEEEKIVRETRKILEDYDLEILATTARVPTRIGHCEAVTVSLRQEVSREDLVSCFSNAPGVYSVLGESYEDFPTLTQWEARAEVFVTRLRLPVDHKRARLVQYWNMADNLAKGAATNAVQILSCLVGGKG